MSNTLVFELLDPQIITKKPINNLLLGCMISAIQNYSFILLPVGLIPKFNRGLYYIHHLSHPQSSSTINFFKKNLKFTIYFFQKYNEYGSTS